MITSLLAFARRHIILFGAAKFTAGLVVGFALGVYFLPILTAEEGLDQTALAQLEAGSLKLQIAGLLGWLGWRSVYLAKQVSSRNQAMVAFDWAKTSLFGRDLSRF